MNDLSWMIYWAGAFGKASVIFSAGIGLLGLFVVFPAMVLWGVTVVYSDDMEDRVKTLVKSTLRHSLIAWSACIIGTVFTPSSDTVYAMAASEMGEKVARSETADKALKALNSWLDRQIAETPKKEGAQ